MGTTKNTVATRNNAGDTMIQENRNIKMDDIVDFPSDNFK